MKEKKVVYQYTREGEDGQQVTMTETIGDAPKDFDRGYAQGKSDGIWKCLGAAALIGIGYLVGNKKS